ncbi:hypothetical protein [Bacillus sp. FJAT-45066]|uniref:hypothetical protein n=1 Tax=Bacillus sp. FJAT-45066 TaxID=2011010 RepID=UPI000BB70874|nr:hypothetical protein [Bacillus sp. FJAT-45066]
MSQTHSLHIIDFETTTHKTTFVKITIYDAIFEKMLEGEVKFVGGMPYGDIIHRDRSTLSPECRQYVQARLLEKYNEGDFD